MSKNETRRRKIKRFIKQYIPKSSFWRNLLSTRFRKCQSETSKCKHVVATYKAVSCYLEDSKLLSQKFKKKGSQKITIVRTGRANIYTVQDLNSKK